MNNRSFLEQSFNYQRSRNDTASNHSRSNDFTLKRQRFPQNINLIFDTAVEMAYEEDRFR